MSAYPWRHRRHLIGCAALWCATALTPALATPQIPDEMLLDGVPGALMTDLLEPILVNPQQRQKLNAHVRLPPCTASWRGYRAFWEIRDGKLLLQNVVANPCDENPIEVPLSVFFTDGRAPMDATWFSGYLMVPRGRSIDMNPMGYSTRFERYVLFRFERGVQVSREEID